jgi:WD40 repeat protein
MSLYGIDLDRMFFIATADCEMKIWEIKAKKDKCLFKGVHKDDITAFDLEKDLIASAAKDKKIVVWDINTCKEKKVLKGSKAIPICVDLSTDEKLLASGDLEHNVYIWDVETGKNKIFLGHEGIVT